WRNPMIAGGNVSNFAMGAATMGITAFLPAYVQGVMGLSTVVVGLTLTAMSGGFPLGAFTAGQIMLRFSYRAAALTGGILLVAGSLMMIALDAGHGPIWVIVSALLIGSGMGLNMNT